MAVRKEEAKKYFYLSFIVAMFCVIKKLRSFSVAKLWDKFSLPQISVSRIQMSSLLWCKCSDNIEVNATLFQYFLLDQNHVRCVRGDEKQTHICIMTKTPFPLSLTPFQLIPLKFISGIFIETIVEIFSMHFQINFN